MTNGSNSQLSSGHLPFSKALNFIGRAIVFQYLPVTVLGIVLWGTQAALAKSPFLPATNDVRAQALFSGIEWGDDLSPTVRPFSAKTVTTRVARMSWGEVYQIAFEPTRSRSSKQRSISPLLFLFTDNEIVRINAEDPDKAIAELKTLTSPPSYEPADLYGMSHGGSTHQESPLTIVKIVVNGDRCRYTWSHNSGHFLTIEWKRGVGLIEYSQGRGARSDGYRLKRVVLR